MKLTKEKIAEYRKKMKNNPLLFGYVVCNSIVTEQTDCVLHKDICATLLTKPVRQAIISPRGHAKTTWGSTVGTVFDIAYDREDVIVLIKKTFPLAVTDLRNIVTQIKYNERFKLFFGERIFLIDRQEKVYILNPYTGHKTYIEVKGANQSIRGIVVDGKRPTKILLDDFEDENNTLTVEQRNKVREWMAAQVMPSLDVSKGHIIAIGTIVHYDSWLNNLWEGYKQAQNDKKDFSWHVIFHQMIEEDVPIWPEKFTLEYIQQLKASYSEIGRIDMFYQEYMNIPFNIDNADFKREYINYWAGSVYYDDSLGTVIKLQEEGTERIYPADVVVGIDPSSGVAADHTGIVVLAQIPDGRRFLEYAERKMLKPSEVVKLVFDLYDRYKPRIIALEEDTLKTMQEWIRSEKINRNKYIPLKPEKAPHNMNKKLKLTQALQPVYESGVMYHKKYMVAIEEELFAHPKGKRDDIMDALYLASKNSIRPGKKNFNISDKVIDIKRKVYDWMTGVPLNGYRKSA